MKKLIKFFLKKFFLITITVMTGNFTFSQTTPVQTANQPYGATAVPVATTAAVTPTANVGTAPATPSATIPTKPIGATNEAPPPTPDEAAAQAAPEAAAAVPAEPTETPTVTTEAPVPPKEVAEPATQAAPESTTEAAPSTPTAPTEVPQTIEPERETDVTKGITLDLPPGVERVCIEAKKIFSVTKETQDGEEPIKEDLEVKGATEVVKESHELEEAPEDIQDISLNI